MRGAPKILSALAASCAALTISASGLTGSSRASACQIPAVMTLEMPNATEIVPRRAIHPRKQAHRSPVSREVPSSPATGRMNCATCIGMMPAFESHDLMPFMPVAEPFRIHVIETPSGGEPSPAGIEPDLQGQAED